MEIAVIKTGGKQYLVKKGERIKIDPPKNLRQEENLEGKEIIFDKVLLTKKDDNIEIGTPFLEGKKVIGKVINLQKGKKIIVFKYKAKKRERVKKGHRQLYLLVEILEIQ